jgi:hypothetical protein
MKFASGLTPYTEAERVADAERRIAALRLGVTRRNAIRSGQRYDRKPSPAYRRWWLRIMGESDDDDVA